MNNFLPKAVIEPLKWCDAIDPDYALAHAELAIATSLLSVYSDLDKNDAVAQAEPHVERALALDPMLAEAHAAAGRLIKTRDGYTAEGSSLYEKAVQLNPNYTEAWVWLSTNYRYSWPRQYDKSFNAIRIAAQLDPLSSIALAEYINALVQRNKFAEADIELAKLASIKPSLHANLLGFRMSMGGNWASAALGLLNSRLLEPQDLSHRPQLSFLLAVLRLEKEAIAVFDPPRWNVYYHLGRVEDALRIFEARLAEDPESEDAQKWVWDIRADLGMYDQNYWEISEDDWRNDPESWGVHGMARQIDMRQSFVSEADVSDLLSAMKELARREYDGGLIAAGRPDYALGLATFLEGDRERGIELIGKAMNFGYLIPRNRGYLQSLYDDPGFKAILAAQEARNTSERNRFLGIVCNDNPYQSFWQPEEGTCARFAAGGGY